MSRVSLPVSVDIPGERLPAGVEATAYFVVSEALTNVVKHARAARAQVTARVERGELRVEVRDEGVGGPEAVTAPAWAVWRIGWRRWAAASWSRARRAVARACARCYRCSTPAKRSPDGRTQKPPGYGFPYPASPEHGSRFSGRAVCTQTRTSENVLHVLTGFPESDAAAAFARERRRASLARVASRLTTRREDASALLLFADVVAALGRVSERDLGLQTIALNSIVGTVDRRSGEFDRLFRPRARRLQDRWQRIATARRRGKTMPPIDAYRIGELHFVQDGHHRVSVARAHGDTTIEAHVRSVKTAVFATAELMQGDLWRDRAALLDPGRAPLPRPSGTRKRVLQRALM